MRRAIRLMADKGSFFEIGPLWGTDQITGFVRFNGYPMGVIASDSRHVNGGALTADGCDKLAATSTSATSSTCRSSTWSTTRASRSAWSTRWPARSARAASG